MMEHLKRPQKRSLQLAVPLGVEVFIIQPNLLINDIASRFDSLIVGSFLKFLGMVEVLTTYNY